MPTQNYSFIHLPRLRRISVTMLVGLLVATTIGLGHIALAKHSGGGGYSCNITVDQAVAAVNPSDGIDTVMAMDQPSSANGPILIEKSVIIQGGWAPKVGDCQPGPYSDEATALAVFNHNPATRSPLPAPSSPTEFINLETYNAQVKIQQIEIDRDALAPTGPGISGSIEGGSEVLLQNMVIKDNNSGGGAGFNISVYDGSTLIMDNVQVISNTTSTNGGGGYLFIDSGVVTITNSSFSGNRALNGSGGGLVIEGTGSGPAEVWLVDTTFSNNSAGLKPDLQVCGDVTVHVVTTPQEPDFFSTYLPFILKPPGGAQSLAAANSSNITPLAATWQEVGSSSASAGGISNNSGDSFYSSVATAPDSTPYVAWQDDTSGDTEIYVKRWNGCSWVEVGSGSGRGGGISNNTGTSKKPSLAIAPNGTPHIAWEDGTDGDAEIYIKHWNSSSWVEVGSGSASGGGVSSDGGSSSDPSLAIAPNGTPYLAWENGVGDLEIYVKRWNGSSWVEVGSGSASGGGVSNNSGSSSSPSIAIAPNGTPYIAWSDSSSGKVEIYVRHWNGSSWAEVGNGSASGGGISNNSSNSYNPSLAIAPDGTPHSAWEDYSGGDAEIYLKRWNGSSWVEVGSGSASSGGISNNSSYSYSPSLAIAPNGTPYVVWGDDVDGNDVIFEIYVKRWIE